uniref:Ribosomal protein L16 n=1 Tax=Proschkinia sp. SZCZR1824 TaxID=2588390 RepID=A0A4Y5SE10_9STRA|nr:ribosomal protein L16 [Proschkinia sp. SZCZR1824]
MFTGPKQSKYKKTRKGRLGRIELKSNKLKFGDIGLKTLESGFINARHIEAARKAITRKMKRKGKIWIKMFPDIPITSKPSGVRMGKGKGNFSHWATRVKGGRVIFEIAGSNTANLLAAMKSGSAKLPLKTKVFL